MVRHVTKLRVRITYIAIRELYYKAKEREEKGVASYYINKVLSLIV